ncbi:MAG: acyclic terpene utilization AtuA family protein [Pirellula sp.]
MTSIIRVGNAQAFWGDRPSAAVELLSQVPELDFLTMDYLAEVSMSILAIQRQRDPQLGFPLDFVDVVRSLVPYWNSGGKCKLIANAGGLNPMGCARACQVAMEKAGCKSMKIGVVYGDDVLSILAAPKSFEQIEARYANLDSGDPLTNVASRLMTANAYLGCAGIVSALQAGAEIVITGRVADPSMVVAPCVYAFGWRPDEWDRLAGATVAGHLLECGTHVTGGISTDWLDVPNPTHIGFPIAEIDDSGGCTITKSATSGGCVTMDTVKEQLIYEIGNPEQYLSPDVSVSFLGLQVLQAGLDRVSVLGARGRPAPKTLKVSATYTDGFRAAGMLTIFGPQAILKARRCGEMVLQRLRDAGHTYRDSIVECLGNAESVPVDSLVSQANGLYEIVLRIAVESESKEAVECFAKELMPLVTAGPQGTTGYAEGRPRVHGVIRYWPCLIDSELVTFELELLDTTDADSVRKNTQSAPASVSVGRAVRSEHRLPSSSISNADSLQKSVGSDSGSVQNSRSLARFAFGRSGDKGTAANVGILARSDKYYEWLKSWLTSDRVKSFFGPLGIESVERYELPNLNGLNFVIRGILKRGIRNDAQGKSLAQALLSMPVDVPPD